MAPILVATDFSPSALSALNYAADMALVTGSPLVLINIYQVPVSLNDDPVPLITVDELKENSETMIGQLKEKLKHITPGNVEIRTESRLGEIREELQAACDAHQPLLLIVGTTGQSGLERSLFGSTTLEVIEELNWPVLAVPKGTEYGKGIHHIGLAWDFTKADRVLPAERLITLVNTFKAHLKVLHVATDLADNPADATDTVKQALASLSPAYHHIKNADVADGISAFAEEHNLDLIVTVPRKHGFFQSLFNKNSTKQLITGSHLPVLAIH